MPRDKDKSHGFTNRSTWLVHLYFGHLDMTPTAVREALQIEIESLNLSPFLNDFIDLSLVDWEELGKTWENEDEYKGDK